MEAAAKVACARGPTGWRPAPAATGPRAAGAWRGRSPTGRASRAPMPASWAPVATSTPARLAAPAPRKAHRRARPAAGAALARVACGSSSSASCAAERDPRCNHRDDGGRV